MKRTRFFATILSTLAFIGLAGCGQTLHLKTITLTTSGTNLQGIGATVKLKATGNYDNLTTSDLTNRVVYTVTAEGFQTDGVSQTLPLLPPPQTVSVSSTGLVTAVEPAACSWIAVDPSATEIVWTLAGQYKVVASINGIDSQPVFIGVASAAGGVATKGKCGPTT